MGRRGGGGGERAGEKRTRWGVDEELGRGGGAGEKRRN